MNNSLTSALTFVLSVGYGTLALAQLPADMPRPDPGLWQMKTSLAQMGGMSMSFETCIDESIEDLLVQPDDDAQCTDQSYRKDGDRILFEASCRVDGSVARIRGIFTGDFARNYQGQINTTYTPPLHGMAVTDMTMEARWASACKPGQRPGDVEMTGMPSIPGMGDIDLEELMKNLPQR